MFFLAFNLLSFPVIVFSTFSISQGLAPSSPAIDTERLTNPMQISDAAGGNGLGVGGKVEYLDRDIPGIIGILQYLEQWCKLQSAETGAATVGIVDVNVP